MGTTEKDEILKNLTPHDVYGEKLIKSSRGFKMLCPFHEEKNASFNISNDKLSFHCFGCGRKGSAFDFIMIRDKVDFPDALNILAQKTGVDLSKHNFNPRTARLFELNEEATQFYQKKLMSNNRALFYLQQERFLLPESIERFRIGCTDGLTLVSHLRKKGFTDDEIIEAGLGKKWKSKTLDYFRNRIIFPIQQRDKVRGFGGRIVSDDGVPKYLNIHTTPVFHKKEILYGIDPLAIKESGFAIVVEGYLDVIMCHQHGYRNTVSPLGTAFGSDHISLLKRHCDTVYSVFDSDASGKRAAGIIAKLCFDKRLGGGVIILPNGEDPDSFLRAGNSLDALLKEAPPFSVYLAKEFPKSRKMIFNSLLLRGHIETSEFLSHLNSKEELKAFANINARFMVESLLSKAPVVLRNHTIEIRKYANYLALFYKKRFVFWEQIGDDYRKQAEEMRKKLLWIKRC